MLHLVDLMSWLIVFSLQEYWTSLRGETALPAHCSSASERSGLTQTTGLGRRNSSQWRWENPWIIDTHKQWSSISVSCLAAHTSIKFHEWSNRWNCPLKGAVVSSTFQEAILSQHWLIAQSLNTGGDSWSLRWKRFFCPRASAEESHAEKSKARTSKNFKEISLTRLIAPASSDFMA